MPHSDFQLLIFQSVDEPLIKAKPRNLAMCSVTELQECAVRLFYLIEPRFNYRLIKRFYLHQIPDKTAEQICQIKTEKRRAFNFALHLSFQIFDSSYIFMIYF